MDNNTDLLQQTEVHDGWYALHSTIILPVQTVDYNYSVPYGTRLSMPVTNINI